MAREKNKIKIVFSLIMALAFLFLLNSGAIAFRLQESQAAEGENKVNPVEVKVEAFQFGYSPDPIKVKKGDMVKLLVTSRDVKHGFYIKEYGINNEIEKGKITEINFLADKAGEFPVLCTIYCGGGHSSMKGKLIVEDDSH